MALLVLGILAKTIQTLFSPYDLAVTAHSFYGCSDLHGLVTVGDAATGTVRAQLQGNTISEHDFDVVHAHLTCKVSKDDPAVFELNTKVGVGQRFHHNSVDFFLWFFAQGNNDYEIDSGLNKKRPDSPFKF